MEARNIIEAVAWVRKYFVAASVDRGLAFLIRRGMIASMLISKPTHMSSVWEVISVIRVPMTTVKVIKKLAMAFISTGRGMNQHFRGMGPIALLADLT